MSLFSFNLFAQKPLPHIKTLYDFYRQKIYFSAYDIETDTNGYVYFPNGDRIIRFNGYEFSSLNNSFPHTRPSNIINFHKDYYDRIWFSRIDGGLGYISGNTSVNFPYVPEDETNVKYESVYMDSSGVLHLSLRNKGGGGGGGEILYD